MKAARVLFSDRIYHIIASKLMALHYFNEAMPNAKGRKDKTAVLRNFKMKLLVVKDRETRLRTELMDAAPKHIRKFLEEAMVLDSLLEYGSCSRKIVFADHQFGITSGRMAQARLRALQNAWKGNVVVSFNKSESHRIEVYLDADRRSTAAAALANV